MVEVNNLTTNQVDEKFLKEVAKRVLLGENKAEEELSIVLLGQGRIRALNKKYRGKNRVTDVLSFTWPRDSEVRGEKRSKTSAISGQGLGEIAICPREVKKNAKRYNSSFKKEVARVLIHGILHLLGYEHEKSKTEKDKMTEKEEYYFSPWQSQT